MKTSFIISLLCGFLLTACATVQVTADYDQKAKFNTYKTFAFFKSGIDKVDINDLDKRRILRAIDTAMTLKGLTKSKTPDLLVNIHTKAEKNIQVYPNYYGYGWGWTPFWWNAGYVNSYETIEGTLFIDLIDASRKELIWQGVGKAPLVEGGPEAKEERIREIVSAVLAKYPPVLNNSK